jgi:hypothetical protein
MPNIYQPGKPNPYFPKHKYFGIPMNRNIKPIEQCELKGYVGLDAKPAVGFAVEILTAEHLWATFQFEAEDVLKVNGTWIEDDRERNKRINAAYAKLWLTDNRFQWAGLAAFASKQVGCSLLHAADRIDWNRRDREQLQRSLAVATVPGAAAALAHKGMEFCTDEVYTRLGYGNKHLFLDIYPLHRFYMERGWEEFNACLEKRQAMRYPVEWQVDRQILQFGKFFNEVRDGFRQIEANNPHGSVQSLALHEQVNILQRIMYDDLALQGLLATNQFLWATGFPSGNYEEIQLTLSAQCKAQKGRTSFFSRSAFARLWVPDERMKFVYHAADQFSVLLNSSGRSRVETSMHTIAGGGGVT